MERIVEVPQVQVQERVVEVPQVQTVERVVQAAPVQYAAPVQTIAAPVQTYAAPVTTAAPAFYGGVAETVVGGYGGYGGYGGGLIGTSTLPTTVFERPEE